MEKIKNIFSPGRASDDSTLYGTAGGRPEDFTSSPATSDAAAREAAQHAARNSAQSSSAGTGQAPVGASSYSQGLPSQSERPNTLSDDASAASIKSDVVGVAPGHQQSAASPKTTTTQHPTSSRQYDQSGPTAALAAATAAGASSGASSGRHAGHGPEQGLGAHTHHEGYAHVQPATTASKVPLGGGPRAEALVQEPHFANRAPPQYDPHGRHDLAAAAAAATGPTSTVFGNPSHQGSVTSGTTAPSHASINQNSNPSAATAANTAWNEPSNQTDSQNPSHLGRDTALASSGAAAAAGIAGGSKHDRLDDASSSGPAQRTIGPHKSDVLNVIDPRVQPEPQQMKKNDVTVERADTGPASKTIGPHKSDILNVLDPRVQPDPAKMKTSDSRDPVGTAPLQQSSSAGSANPGTAAATSTSNIGSGPNTARTDYSDRGALSDTRNDTSEGGWTNPYSSAPLDPRIDNLGMPGGFPETPAEDSTTAGNYGARDAALLGSGPSTATGAHNAARSAENDQPATTDFANVSARGEGTRLAENPSSGGGLSNVSVNSQSHSFSEDSGAAGAGAAGAGAAGLGAYEAAKHHDTPTEGREPLGNEPNMSQVTAANTERNARTAPTGIDDIGAIISGQQRGTREAAVGSDPDATDADEYDPFKYDGEARLPDQQTTSTIVTGLRRPEELESTPHSGVRDSTKVPGAGAAGVTDYDAPRSDGATEPVQQQSTAGPSTGLYQSSPGTQQHHGVRDAAVAGGVGAIAASGFEALHDDVASERHEYRDRRPPHGILASRTGEQRFGRDSREDPIPTGAATTAAGHPSAEMRQPYSQAPQSSTVEPTQHHYGRDAAIGGGAGVAGLGAYEALKDHGATKDQYPQTSAATPSSAPGASGLGSAQRYDDRDAAVGGGVGVGGTGPYETLQHREASTQQYQPKSFAESQPPIGSQAQPPQHHYARDAAIGTGAGVAGAGAYETLKDRDASQQQYQPASSEVGHAPLASQAQPTQHHQARDAAIGGGAGAAGAGAYENMMDSGTTKQQHAPTTSTTSGTGTNLTSAGGSASQDPTGSHVRPGAIYPLELNQPHRHQPTTAETAGGLAPDSATGDGQTQQGHLGRDATIGGAAGAATAAGVYEAEKRHANATGQAADPSNVAGSSREIYGDELAQPRPHAPTTANTAGGLQPDSASGRDHSGLATGAAAGGLNGAGVAGRDHAADHPPSAAQHDPVGALQAATSRRFEDQRAIPQHHGHEVNPVTGDIIGSGGQGHPGSNPMEEPTRQAHPHGLAGAASGAAAGFALDEKEHRAGHTQGDSVTERGGPHSQSFESSRHSEEGSTSPKQKKHRFSNILHRKSRSRDLSEEHRGEHAHTAGRQSGEAAQFEHGDEALEHDDRSLSQAHGDQAVDHEGHHKSGLLTKLSLDGHNKLHKEPPPKVREALQHQGQE